MRAIAYLANEFPSALEPYVMDEIAALRRRGVDVVCCSGKRVSPNGLSLTERVYWKETRYSQPLTDSQLADAARRLIRDRRTLWEILRPLLFDPHASPLLRVRALGHTLMGAALADDLAPLNVGHIHVHHGYFASWMALVAARLLDIGFSFTLHGSDLLLRADLLAPKLKACSFCITVSEFNRRYILHNYPSIAAEKILVQRLGVDRVLSWPSKRTSAPAANRPFCLLAVGRLHPIKDYAFLLQACSALRRQSFDFLCWIVGEGPDRSSLECQISRLGLQSYVHLIGQVPRTGLVPYYRNADLVVSTSKSEGVPVALMEAMSHERIVLAPRITGVPELVEDGRTGFLYAPGSLPSFLDRIRWIYENQASLAEIRRAASARVAASFNRQRNLLDFTEQFLAHIPNLGGNHAHPLLQQVRLSI